MLSYIFHADVVQDTRHEFLFAAVSHLHISYFLLHNDHASDQKYNIKKGHANLQPIPLFLENLDLGAEARFSFLKVALLGEVPE